MVARNLYLDRAVQLLQRREDRKAEDFRLEGQLLLELGRADEGYAAYRKAVEREPHQVRWRWELVQRCARRRPWNASRKRNAKCSNFSP